MNNDNAHSGTQSSKTEQSTADWHVLGAGAMGCLWAARLREARRNVTLLLRNDAAVQSVQANEGIALESGNTVQRFQVGAFSGQSSSGTIKRLLLATKAQDAQSALNSISHLLAQDSCIVLLQNGLKVQQQITAALGTARVYCLSTSHGAWLRHPFHVVAAGTGEAWLGQLGGGASAASIRDASNFDADLMHSLAISSMNVRHDPDIATRLWQKFAVNCCVNALTALYNCRNGELLTLPHARAELYGLCAETAWIITQLPGASADFNLTKHFEFVLKATAMNYSSTLQDVRNRRSNEIDHLNGYLCELAHQQGLKCPLNEDVLRRFNALTQSD